MGVCIPAKKARLPVHGIFAGVRGGLLNGERPN